jgi:multidrug efflux system outer membrane protein
VRRALILTLCAAVAGCTLEPHYVRPTPSIPATWPVGAAYPAPSEEALPSLSYRQVFRDPHVQAIIAQALAKNQDLAAAMANVQIARAQYGVQRAQLFPQVSADLNGAESHGQSTGAGSGGQSGNGAQTTRNYQANIGFTAFELDLFGRLRSLSHAAQERYFASEAGARAARLTLVGEVATAYLTLAADRSLLAIAQGSEASNAKTVDLTQAMLNGGVTPRTTLAQAQTQLEQSRSDRAALTTQVAQDRNALELLAGGPVADADLPASIESVDGLLGEAPAGLDSRILLRRPDVAEAEYQLRAANAQIGAARAAFFPTISLTALAGAASPQLASLFSGGAFAWQGQAGASLPLFAGGANVANLSMARGERDLAVATYQKAVQSAFRDVANALARQGTIADQTTAQTRLEAAARDNYNLSMARFREGVDPYLNALIAERTEYAAQQTLAATRFTRANNLVLLYQSLGGDELIDAMQPPPVTTAKR